MTREVATVAPETPVKEVARELVERGISGMPVVDEDGRVVGVVSEADVLAIERGNPVGEDDGRLARLLHRREADDGRATARSAGQAMTSPAITIEPFWTLPSAAHLMLERAVNRLPVVAGKRLVGIVTRADLVRAFARSDESVAQEIREQLREQQAIWLDGCDVEVTVAGGETTLTGSVLRRSDAELLPKSVARVPGVVGVHADLTWSEDD
jgi:CBS domain-containing protein